MTSAPATELTWEASSEGEVALMPLPVSEKTENPFKLWVIGPTGDMPQQRMYLALHNDYSEVPVWDTDLPEDRCGEIVVRRLLKGDRGHYGPLEHAHLSVLLRVDHDTMVQLRTHRIASFDVQSNRYTGQRFIDVATGERSVRDVFHFRPPGTYRDRQGDPYNWTESDNAKLAIAYRNACHRYHELRKEGISEEHARQVLPGAFFQNVFMTMNARMWLHLLDVRLKPDAQYEIRWAMELLTGAIRNWIPEIANWYMTNRQNKARLAP